MAIQPPPELVAGGSPPGAGWLNQFVAYLQSCRIAVDPSSGLVGSIGAGGTTIGIQDTPPVYLKITYNQGDGSYSWIEQVPAPSGAWTNGFRQGYALDDPARGTVPADPAWEANVVNGIATGYRVQAYRDPAVGRLTFQTGTCSS